MKTAFEGRLPILPSLVVLLFVLTTIFHLVSALKGYPQFRDQHLGAAIDYSRNGIDFMRPIIPGFDANRVGTPQEPPFWQALAALAIRVGNGHWAGANMVSLLCFALGLWPLWKIASECLSARAAWWVVASFLSQPLIFLVAGQASVDGLSLVFAIWFFYATCKLVRTGEWIWIPISIGFGALAATAKLPLFMAAGAGAGFLLILEQRQSLVRWIQLVGVGAVCAFVFFVWNQMTTSILLTAEYPQVKLWVKDNPQMMWWYFGDWAFRLNPANWIKGGWSALNCLFGSFTLAGLFFFGLFQKKLRPACCWLAGAVLTMLIFSHLILVHRHYYILFSPAIALFVGAALALLEEKFLSGSVWVNVFGTVALIGLLLLGTIQGLVGMEVVLNYDPYCKRMATFIRDHVGEKEKILIDGGGWGQMLMLADRDGLNIFADKMLSDPANVRDLHQRGFNKLVMLSESPLLWALKKTNPGAGELQRETYREHWVEVIDRWPTLYQDEDIVIKRVEVP